MMSMFLTNISKDNRGGLRALLMVIVWKRRGFAIARKVLDTKRHDANVLRSLPIFLIMSVVSSDGTKSIERGLDFKRFWIWIPLTESNLDRVFLH